MAAALHYDDEFQTVHAGDRWGVATIRAALFSKGYSEKTVKEYTNGILRAREWAKDHGWGLDNIPATVLARYNDALPKSRSSRNMAKCSLAAYWELTGRDNPPLGALRVPRKPRFRPRAVSEDESKRLARTAYEWVSGPEGLAVMLGLYIAMRRFEIAKARWDEFSDDLSEITFMGKLDVVATLPVHPLVVQKLEWWRDVYQPSDDPTDTSARPGKVYVFPAGVQATKHPHVAPGTVSSWVTRVAKRAGVEASSHQLRHTCLTEMNDRTKDLRAVQDFARHQDPATTSGYTRIRQSRLRELSESLGY